MPGRAALDGPLGRAGRAGWSLDQLFVGGLDGEEPHERPAARRIRVMGLGQAPVGSLDLVERGAARQSKRAIWVGVESHGRGSQPISSPTGTSSNSGTASAAVRPCGSRLTGR